MCLVQHGTVTASLHHCIKDQLRDGIHHEKSRHRHAHIDATTCIEVSSMPMPGQAMREGGWIRVTVAC